MAKAELFRVPVLRFFVKLFGAYPVNRDKADVSSIKTTINILRGGEVVGMYPQGRRAKHIPPKNVTPKNGVAMVAVKAETGILPVTVISKGYKAGIFRKTLVVFGKYIPFEELSYENGSKINENINLYKRITERVYGEILANYEKYDVLNKK
jgi:1-acyl-sn-glycerol-3-phosphate acyltransferase